MAAKRPVDPLEPDTLGRVLSQLFQQRGYGRPRATQDLQQSWATCVGPETARHTRVLSYRNGVLKVAVRSAALVGELNGFRKRELLQAFAEQFPRQRVRDLKFQLRTDLPLKD